MKTFIKKNLQSLLFVPVLALGIVALAPSAGVYAQDSDSARDALRDAARNSSTGSGGSTNDRIGVGVNATGVQDDGPSDVSAIIETVTGILLFLVGAVAVIMIIYGGFKYITSGGDSSAVTSAKNTILYAVIGLIIAILAYAIINFVRTNIAA